VFAYNIGILIEKVNDISKKIVVSNVLFTHLKLIGHVYPIFRARHIATLQEMIEIFFWA